MGRVRCQVENNLVKEIHKVIVHRFRMGDVEDPDLYAAEPLWQWQQSESGQWVMEHAIEAPIWHRQHDISSFGYQYIVVAELEAKKLTEFYLRWGNPNERSNSF